MHPDATPTTDPQRQRRSNPDIADTRSFTPPTGAISGLGLLLLACLTVPSPVRAEPSPRCIALKAEARSTASLLGLPHVELRALRAPVVGDGSGIGLPAPEYAQVRGGVAYAPLDLWKARSVEAIADAECRRHVSREALESVLLQGASFGRVPAVESEREVLQAGSPRADALVADAEERLSRGLVTLPEVDTLRLQRLSLAHRIGELNAEHAALPPPPPLPDASLDDLLAAYERASLDVTHEESFTRQLSAFRVDLQAGAIPWPRPDWFGMVTLTYGLGHLAQPGAEAELLRARAEDLRVSAGELRTRVDRFVDAMQASATALLSERSVIDRQLELLDRRLAPTPDEPDRARLLKASLELERLHLQGRRASVERLALLRQALGRTKS